MRLPRSTSTAASGGSGSPTRAKAGKLKVLVDDDKTKKGAEKLSYKHKIKQELGRKARAGFTAATGGGDADMDILSWKLKQK